jgi:hypothetical protein
MNTDEREDYRHIIDLLPQAGNLGEKANFDDPLEQPAICLADIETGFRYAIGYRKEAFRQFEREIVQRNLAFQPRINALETLISELTTGKRELNETSRSALIVCSGLYIVGTRIYAVNEGRDAHYLVVRYPNAQESGYFLLRPACAAPQRGSLTADERESVIAEVLHLDRTFHPQRFSGPSRSHRWSGRQR